MTRHEVFNADGQVIESYDLTPEEEKERNFLLRASAYPTLTDQIEALWKAVEGTAIAAHPAAKAILDKIAAVKAQFPTK